MRSTTAIRTAIVAAGMTTLALLTAPAAAQAAPAAPAEAVTTAAAQCVYLNRTYADGFNRYAEVKNRCAGSYRAKVVVNNWADTSCFTIGGYATKQVRTGGVASPNASHTQYC